MKMAASLVTAFLAAGCSSHAQVQYGAGSVTSSARSAGLSVHSSGSNAAALIGLGIAAGLMSQAHSQGMHYNANPFMVLSEPAPVPAPELASERKVNEQDCTRPIEDSTANLRCR